MSDFISIGKIFSTHGLKGNVKIESYIENFAYIIDNESALDEKFNNVKIQIQSNVKNTYICKYENIDCIDDAKKLMRKEIFVNKKDFPDLKEGEVYAFDAIGFFVIAENSDLYGEVFDVADYGCGNSYCITLSAKYAKNLGMKNSIILCNDPVIKSIIKAERKIMLNDYNVIDIKTL
jgi:16S rRNA processing protein RimM